MTLLAFLLLCGCVAGALGYLYQRERNAVTTKYIPRNVVTTIDKWRKKV
jgi:hypothetical protein